MGLFANLFGKQNCVFCGAECGAMHRDKIKSEGENLYICNVCKRKCSRYIRVSEMNRSAVEEHMAFMERRDKIYRGQFGHGSNYPPTINKQGICFDDGLGMLAVIDVQNAENKEFTEVIRYDEIASYKMYTEVNKPAQQGQPETFKESGVILTLYTQRDRNDAADRRGLRPHPYITREIKLCMRTSEKDTEYADNAIQHLDHIFGVNTHSHPLFGGKSTAEKRGMQAAVDMKDLMKSIADAAVSGNADPEDPAIAEKFAKAQASEAAYRTDGLIQYTQRADKAEASAVR